MAGTLDTSALRDLERSTDRALILTTDALGAIRVAHRFLDVDGKSACALARAAGHLDDAIREINAARDHARGRAAA
jgi:hypothetical protein